ncbi:hypothetical protein Tco_1192034 [Tanacetum coccineum]
MASRLSHLNIDAINHLQDMDFTGSALKLNLKRSLMCARDFSAKANAVRECQGKKYIRVSVDTTSRFNMVKEEFGQVTTKADICIFIGYAPMKKAFWIYNRRTRRIIETIHVDFDELTAMASEHSSSGPALHEMTPVTISSGLVPNPPSSTPFVPPSRSDWDLLFQLMFDESLNSQPYVDLQAPKSYDPILE